MLIVRVLFMCIYQKCTPDLNLFSLNIYGLYFHDDDGGRVSVLCDNSRQMLLVGCVEYDRSLVHCISTHYTLLPTYTLT